MLDMDNDLASRVNKLEKDLREFSASQIVGGDNSVAYSHSLIISDTVTPYTIGSGSTIMGPGLVAHKIVFIGTNPFPLIQIRGTVSENGVLKTARDRGTVPYGPTTPSGNSLNIYSLYRGGGLVDSHSLEPYSPGIAYQVIYGMEVNGTTTATTSYEIDLEIKTSCPGILYSTVVRRNDEYE